MKPSGHGSRRSAPSRAHPFGRIVLAVAAVCVLACPVLAQTVPVLPDDSPVRLDAPGLLPKKPRPGLPDVKAQPQAWPRLDRGAVICRSEADLSHLAARRRGEVASGPVDCQIVRGPTAISILQRRGPGMTQIRTTDPTAGGSGWTDAWLPEKPPSR